MTYCLEHGVYRFILNIDNRTIDIYKGGWMQKTLNNLPIGIQWEDLELILSHEDKGVKENLAKKLFELYQKS